MGEGFESLFFGLGAVSPPALTPRVNKGRSVGATAKPSGVTAWRPSAQAVQPPNLAVPPLASRGGKNFLPHPPPFFFVCFPQDNKLYFNGSF